MLKQSAVLKKKKKSPQAFSTDLETLKIAGKEIEKQRIEDEKRARASTHNEYQMIEEDKYNE